MPTKSGLFLKELEPEQSHNPPQHSHSPQSPNGNTTFSMSVTSLLHLHHNLYLHCSLLLLLLPSTMIFALELWEMLRMVSPFLPISLAHTCCNVNVTLKVPFYLVLFVFMWKGYLEIYPLPGTLWQLLSYTEDWNKIYSKNVVTTHITTTAADYIQISIPTHFNTATYTTTHYKHQNASVTLHANVMYCNVVENENHVENVMHVEIN